MGRTTAALMAAALLGSCTSGDDTAAAPSTSAPTTTTTTIPVARAAHELGSTAIDAIEGTPTGPGVDVLAARTGDTRDELVLYVDDSHPDRIRMGYAMESPPDDDDPAGICVAGYTAELDRSGPTPTVSVGAVIDLDADTFGEQQRTVCEQGAQFILRVRLDAPLDATTLVDATTGATLPVRDGARLLRPTTLPEGWTLGFEWVEGELWNRTYGESFDAPPAIHLALQQGRGTSNWAQQVRPTGRRTIRGGIDAELLGNDGRLALTWTEDGVPIFVTIAGVTAVPLPELEALLLAFVEDLRYAA